MIRPAFDAILLDIDGTLLTDDERIGPRTLAGLRAAIERGVRVMLATGRSEGGVRPIYQDLPNESPAVVFNGAGLYCPRRDRLVEERVLSPRVVERTLAFARRHGLLAVVMRAGEKLAPAPRDPEESEAIRFLEDLRILASDEPVPSEGLLRITLFARHGDSAALAEEVDRFLDMPAYLTHFPLCALPRHRKSRLDVIDVQPPCRGKAEALRVLQDLHGIPAERVVAVGDADNDVPMLRAAGLGVAMENSSASARAAADRVIGSNNADAIADLLEELF